MMELCESKLLDLLRAKYACLERMEAIFLEQKILLDNGGLEEFPAKCTEVDNIVNQIMQLEQEIGRLERRQEENGYDEDSGTISLIGHLSELSKKNKLILGEMTQKLQKMRDEIRKELDGTIAQGQIKGYKPFSQNRALYLDRFN